MLFPKLLHKTRREPRKWRIRGVVVTFDQFRDYIVRRDGVCLAWRMDPLHVCRGRDGRIHSPDNIFKLTLDHVPERGRSALSKKAADDEHHIVAMCHRLNGGGGNPSHDLREFSRQWIEDHEGPLPVE